MKRIVEKGSSRGFTTWIYEELSWWLLPIVRIDSHIEVFELALHSFDGLAIAYRSHSAFFAA